MKLTKELLAALPPEVREQLRAQVETKPRKYHNVKVEVDGIKFDSKKEAARYGQLVLLLRSGTIADLQCHPVFPLVVNGVKIGKYTGDFQYMDKGRVVVEDVKAKVSRTTAYRLRKRLVKACLGIDIVEV